MRISDTGPGVPANIKDKIFDPFYTTKSDSTGIGLSLCHRIIMDHGGFLGVSSSRWGGAQFLIEIPVEKEKV
jgi:signal transduction histidine kinase